MTKIPKQVLKAGHILQSYYLIVLFKLLVKKKSYYTRGPVNQKKNLRNIIKNWGWSNSAKGLKKLLKEEPPKEAIEKMKVIDKKLIKF